MSTYVEFESDHHFSAFLAHLTPGKVLKDRERGFSKQERKRQLFLRQKAAVEREARRVREIQEAVMVADLMRTR